MTIYKPCDIRGHVCTEITPELYRSWGQTLGCQLPSRSKFVAGGDVRLSTAGFLAALVDGLCRAGLDVVDLGCLPTPMIYYAQRRLAAAGCAIVTASHNPPDFNGLKWMLGDYPPTADEVRLLETAAGEPPGVPSDRTRSESRTVDTTFDYVAWLQETWVDARAAQLHVVLDPMHGCWAGRARRYLHAIFPGLVISTIHDKPDPVFGGHAPDCSVPQRLAALAEAIDQQRADLGIAFDGDGDRVAFVDGRGNVLTAEEATWVLLQSFAGELDGKPFVYDLKFSDRIPPAAAALGARPVAQRSGHAFIRTKMVASGAPFGAEVSGHYFFGLLGGGDDGLFCACQMIAHLAASGKALSDWRRECPPVTITPDLRLRVEPENQENVIQQVRQTWADHPQSALDGVRIDFPDGWVLLRRSVTEPVMTCRFEATDQEKLVELVDRFCTKLPGLGDQLWDRYDEAMRAVE